MSDHTQPIENGQLKYLSVSAIEKFDPEQVGGCPRKYWFRYVAKIPEEKKGSQVRGHEIHAQIEEYLKTGRNVLGQVAQSGQHFLGRELVAESPDLVTTELAFFGPLEVIPGVPLLGKIDFLNCTNTWIDNDGEKNIDSPNTIEICDWKTTSSIKQYAKRGAALSDTIQMCGYGMQIIESFDASVDLLRLSHGYLQTSGARTAQKVSAIFSVDIFHERWQKIQARAREIVDVVRETDQDRVPINLRACSEYGGCSFRGQCNRPSSAVLHDLFSLRSPKMSSLRGQVAAQTGVPAAQPSAQPYHNPVATPQAYAQGAQPGYAPQTNPTRPEVLAEVQRLRHQPPEHFQQDRNFPQPVEQLTQATQPVCGKCGAYLNHLNSCLLQDRVTIVHVGCPAAAPQIAPPDAPRSQPSASAQQLPPGAFAGFSPPVQHAVQQFYSETLRAAQHVPAQAPEPTTTAVPQTQPAAKKTRARRAGASAPAASGGGDLEDAICGGGIALFVDVRTDGVALNDLEAYCAQCVSQLQQHFQIDDLRGAPQDHPLAFGRWRPALAALVKAQPPPPGCYALNYVGESEYRQVIVETLRPQCNAFVRGTR